MLAERHLGHGVGEEDELLGRVATGDDDVHVGRSLPEHVEHLAERNEVVVKRVRQLVEDDQIPFARQNFRARRFPRRSRSGSIATEALSASWDLTFSGDADPCKYLPADWLYEASVPRTKFVAPFPNASFKGRLEIDGEAIELGGWPGMIGHNWGSEHAERWVWLEGTGFAEDPSIYFDAGAARVRVGPWTTPWLPSGMLVLDGEEHRLGGFGQIRSASIEAEPGACEFTLPGKDIVVRGRVSAPKKDFVGWVYADPKGPEHHTLNCSVSDLELTVERPALPARRLTLAAGAAYEFGLRETDHGIPIQPYPDG